MTGTNAAHSNVIELPRRCDYSEFARGGVGFARMLGAVLPTFGDEAHDMLPEGWRDLSAVLCTLAEDEGMNAKQIAEATHLPVEFVIAYLDEFGI